MVITVKMCQYLEFEGQKLCQNTGYKKKKPEFNFSCSYSRKSTKMIICVDNYHFIIDLFIFFKEGITVLLLALNKHVLA